MPSSVIKYGSSEAFFQDVVGSKFAENAAPKVLAPSSNVGPSFCSTPLGSTRSAMNNACAGNIAIARPSSMTPLPLPRPGIGPYLGSAIHGRWPNLGRVIADPSPVATVLPQVQRSFGQSSTSQASVATGGASAGKISSRSSPLGMAVPGKAVKERKRKSRRSVYSRPKPKKSNGPGKKSAVSGSHRNCTRYQRENCRLEIMRQ